MNVETYEQRVLIPSDGMLLYDGEVISDKVYLGKKASANDWEEITKEKATEIENAQKEELTKEYNE